MDAKAYADAVKNYDRATRDALDHLESVLDTPEAVVAGWELSTRKVSPALPGRIQDLPPAYPVKEETVHDTTPATYVHVHKWQRKASFEERVQAVSAATVKQMNFDLEELRRRREASTYRRMNWEDVLAVHAGKAVKQKSRKGNGAGRPPVSLEYLREKELNGKHLD